MRILILGGTAWLGGHLVRAAVARGHEVTCLARRTPVPPLPGVRFVSADRDGAQAYDEVENETWDAVVDLASQPGHVRKAAAALAGRSASFVFVSSVSVYLDTTLPGQDEGAALRPGLDGDVMESMQTYAEAKVACEGHVLDSFGASRSFIVRPGLIGGPGDVSDRTGYWPLRFARAADRGAVLVPDEPALMTQLIDVRDLADWIVEGASAGLGGVFNATGLPVSLERHLQAARAIAGHVGRTIAAAPAWLLAHAVKPWSGSRSMPLWLPMPAYAGFGARDSGAATASGLRTRPLEATLRDVLAWELERAPRATRQAGLSDEDERDLLRELASSPC